MVLPQPAGPVTIHMCLYLPSVLICGLGTMDGKSSGFLGVEFSGFWEVESSGFLEVDSSGVLVEVMVKYALEVSAVVQYFFVETALERRGRCRD